MERTFAWLARYRRLTIRYEHLVAMHRAFLHLGCALVCWNYLQRFWDWVSAGGDRECRRLRHAGALAGLAVYAFASGRAPEAGTPTIGQTGGSVGAVAD